MKTEDRLAVAKEKLVVDLIEASMLTSESVPTLRRRIKRGILEAIQKQPEKEIILELNKIVNAGIGPEAFARTIQPQPAFKWQGFPNPVFVLKSVFENEK